jgi:hypothetical protein
MHLLGEISEENVDRYAMKAFNLLMKVHKIGVLQGFLSAMREAYNGKGSGGDHKG